MPHTLVRVWDQHVYPWGWQVRVDFTDGTRERNEVLVFHQGEPDTATFDAAVAAKAAFLDQAALAPPPEYAITNDDGSITYV